MNFAIVFCVKRHEKKKVIIFPLFMGRNKQMQYNARMKI